MEMAKSPNTTHGSSPALGAPANMASLVRNYLPTSMSSSLGNASPSTSEPAHIRARREAKRADNEYREALDALEVIRLRVEEQVEMGLRIWDRWERERLGAIKTGEFDELGAVAMQACHPLANVAEFFVAAVFRQYEGIVRDVPKRLQAAAEPIAVAVEACQPDKE
jgi:hypothetical protein